MVKSSVKAHFYLFLAQVIYGISFVYAKEITNYNISPLCLVTFRVTGACVLFWVTSLFVPTHKIEKSDLKKLAFLSLFGVFINQLLFINGISLSTPINSAIMMISNPIVVFLILMITAKEKMSKYNFVGILLGITGAIFLILYRGSVKMTSTSAFGDLLTLLNSISWGVFVVFSKSFIQKYNAVSVMRWVFLFGSIYLIPFGLPNIAAINWVSIPYSIIGLVIFIVFGATYLAYLLNMYALKTLSSSVISSYIYLQPLITAVFAIYLGKDYLSVDKIIAAIIIIFGVMLVNKK